MKTGKIGEEVHQTLVSTECERQTECFVTLKKKKDRD